MAEEMRNRTGLILCYSKTNDEPTNVYRDGDDHDHVIGALPMLIVAGIADSYELSSFDGRYALPGTRVICADLDRCWVMEQRTRRSMDLPALDFDRSEGWSSRYAPERRESGSRLHTDWNVHWICLCEREKKA